MMTAQPRLGFIGLGVMGRPLALHLIEAGHAMSVYARRPDATAPLIAAGALQQLNALVGSGGGKSDFSRMIEVLERASER